MDKVSRTSSDEEFGFLLQDKKVDCNSTPYIAELLALCNPDKKENNLNHHDAHIIMARIMQSVKKNIPKDKLSCSFALDFVLEIKHVLISNRFKFFLINVFSGEGNKNTPPRGRFRVSH